MTAIVPQPGQLSPEAARLRQYLRWATIPNFVAIAALFAIDHVTQARPALIMALLIALNACAVRFGRRRTAPDAGGSMQC